MKEAIARVIRYYGSAVTVVTEAGSVETRAFLQPVTSKSWQNMRKVIQGLGEIELGQFLYLGPAEPDLAAATEVVQGQEHYRIRRTEQICLKEEALYCWGLLTKEGGEDPWNS
nr:MAG TPA: hypothetical protein [Caudoviricetes sp.]